MEIQQRSFNQVYTLEYTVSAGTFINSSTPKYFTGYPVLEDKKIKAITFYFPLIGTGLNNYFLTIVNKKGQQLLYNYPMNNLQQNYDNGVSILSYNRLNLFNLENIDLLNSYFTSPLGIGYLVTTTLFRLNFYW